MGKTSRTKGEIEEYKRRLDQARLDGDRFKIRYYLDLLREAGVKGVA